MIQLIDHFDAHDIIALVLIIGGLIIYYLRPDQEVLAIITMVAGFYFGRNITKINKKSSGQ